MLWKGSAARRRLVRWCCLAFGVQHKYFSSWFWINTWGKNMPLSILQGIRFSRNCLLPPAPLPPIISGSNWERFNAPLNAATPPPPRPLENTLLKTALLGTWSSIEGQLCKTSWSVVTLRLNPAANCGVSPSLSQYALRRFFSDQIDAFVTSLQCSVHYHRGTLCLEK